MWRWSKRGRRALSATIVHQMPRLERPPVRGQSWDLWVRGWTVLHESCNSWRGQIFWGYRLAAQMPHQCEYQDWKGDALRLHDEGRLHKSNQEDLRRDGAGPGHIPEKPTSLQADHKNDCFELLLGDVEVRMPQRPGSLQRIRPRQSYLYRVQGTIWNGKEVATG